MHNGIARHGRIIVGVWFPTPTEFHAYEVEEGDYQLLDIPNSVSSDARDVNPSGEIVGFFTDSANKTHGFLLRKGDFWCDIGLSQIHGPTHSPEVITAGRLRREPRLAPRDKSEDVQIALSEQEAMSLIRQNRENPTISPEGLTSRASDDTEFGIREV